MSEQERNVLQMLSMVLDMDAETYEATKIMLYGLCDGRGEGFKNFINVFFSSADAIRAEY